MTSTTATLKDRLLAAEIGKFEGETQVIESSLRGMEEEGWHNRQSALIGNIGPQAAEAVFNMFNKWHWLEGQLGITTPAPFHLGLNSPNGRYIDAFAGYDIIDRFQRLGHKITIQNTGEVGTQALVMMQAADRRIMTPRSTITIKETEVQARGNTNDIKDAIKFLRLLEEHGWRLLAERTKGKVTVEMLKEKTYRGTLWELTAEQALELGFIDDIDTSIQVFPRGPRYEDLLASDGDSLEVRQQKAEARLFLLQSDLLRMKHLQGISALDECGQVMLFNMVAPETCGAVQSAMHMLHRRGAKNVDLLLNSPGGEVASGSGLMDVLGKMDGLTTSIYGMAASMGGFLSQMGTKRRMSRNSYFMIHQVSTMFGDSSSHAEERQESMEKLQDRMFGFMAERTGGKLSLADLKDKCKEHDWWLTPQEALDAGLIDEII